MKVGETLMVLREDRDWMRANGRSPEQWVGKRCKVVGFLTNDPGVQYVVVEMLEGPWPRFYQWHMLVENVGMVMPCPMKVNDV